MKNCPFCGNDNIFIGTIEQTDGAAYAESTNYNDTHYEVVCDFNRGGCGASTGGWHKTKESALNGWNMRI